MKGEKVKRYVRNEDGNIYDRLNRRHIEVRSQRLVGNMWYVNPGDEDEAVISRGDIEEKSQKEGEMIKFEEEMREKDEIVREFNGSGGKEIIFKACLLELVADFRDLKRNERVEAETLAREVLKVKSDVEDIKQKLDLG